jgi:membrane associated rhomboid family serine protease
VRTLIHAYGLVPATHKWPAFLPSLLFHAGFVHAASNIVTLWVFGGTLEDRFGRVRFLALYLVSALTAAIATMWALPYSTFALLGAGGAVAGVIAAYLMLFPRSRVLLLIPLPILFDLVEVPATIVPGFWLLLQVIGNVEASGPSSTAAATVVWMAIGGAAPGLLAARWLVRPERARVEWWSP